MIKLSPNIFSINNIGSHKNLIILGIKFKIKFKKKHEILLCKINKSNIQNMNLYAKVTTSSSEDGNILYEKKRTESYFINKFFKETEKFDIIKSYESLIRGLDEESIATVNCILSRMQKHINSPEFDEIDIFTIEEKNEIRNIRTNFNKKIIKINDNCYNYDKYFLPTWHFETCVFYGKHEIERLCLDKIKNKDIIDAGGFIGDSAIVLSDYTNQKVYSFEPVTENFNHLLKAIELNNKKNIIPIQKGLSSKEKDAEISLYSSASTINFTDRWTDKKTEKIKLTKLDKFVEENNLSIGLIKSDLEGEERNFLMGAQNTIKSQRPTLLISIYHTADDFFNIKTLIENWNLGYNFKIVKPIDGSILAETILIAETNEKN